VSITSRQRPITFTLTDGVTSYVLGSYNFTVTDGLPLNRGTDWRINFDLTASAVDVAFTFQIQGTFEGPWSFLETVVATAGTVTSVERTARGYALRVSADPAGANTSAIVSFEGWSADG
jgi:hypothetical protein